MIKKEIMKIVNLSDLKMKDWEDIKNIIDKTFSKHLGDEG